MRLNSQLRCYLSSSIVALAFFLAGNFGIAADNSLKVTQFGGNSPIEYDFPPERRQAEIASRMFLHKYDPPSCESVLQDVWFKFMLTNDADHRLEFQRDEADRMKTRVVKGSILSDRKTWVSKLKNSVVGAKNVEVIIESYRTKNKSAQFPFKVVPNKVKKEELENQFSKVKSFADNEISVFVDYVSSDSIAFNKHPESRRAVEMVFESNGKQCFLKHLRIHDQSKKGYRITNLDSRSCMRLESLLGDPEQELIFQKSPLMKGAYESASDFREHCWYFYRTEKRGTEGSDPATPTTPQSGEN